MLSHHDCFWMIIKRRYRKGKEKGNVPYTKYVQECFLTSSRRLLFRGMSMWTAGREFFFFFNSQVFIF